MHMLSRLKLWQQLLVLVVALATPTLLLGTFYLGSADHTVAQARRELQAARLTHRLGAVLAALANHRSELFALLAGDHNRAAAVTAAQSRLQRLMTRVGLLEVTLHASPGATRRWQAIEAEWTALRQGEAELTAGQAVRAENALIGHVVALQRLLVAQSALNVDPSPRSAALIQLATHDLPDALIAAGEVQWYATSAAVKGYLGGGERRALEIYARRARRDLARSARDLNGASRSARRQIRPQLEAAATAFNTSFGIIEQRIVQAHKITLTAAQLFHGSRRVSSRLQQLLNASYAAMATSVEHRLSRVTRAREITVAITLLTLAGALALAWVIATRLATLIARAIALFERIARGHYDNPIEATGTDEAHQVLRALDDMQRKLRAQLEQERRIAGENARVRQALDSVSSGVMLADSNYRITYLNPALERELAKAEADIRRDLPAFTVATLRGTSIDVFHKNPAHQRERLARLSQEQRSTFVLGGHTFTVILNPVSDAAGERIGTVVEWFDRSQEVAVEQQMQRMLSAVLDGRLGERIDLQDKSGFFALMSAGINRLADTTAEVVARVQRVTREVRQGADEISAGNANLSQRTEEQSSSLEETASSMEEMTTTVKQNADNAAQASQLALAARDQADRGGTVVNQAVAAMSGINEASTRIAAIIGVIDEIAFQTNLLALNAAVEAARAGEQGRGFAVVASEVRSLAGRSATAAKEIKALIEDSVHRVEDGTVLVAQSGQTLAKIVTAVKKVSDIVAEIAAASREQSLGIEQVNRAVMQMDDLAQQNAALVEQAAAASEAMVEQVRGLNDMLARFHIGGVDPAPAHAPAAARPAPPAGPERRRAGRPWAERARSRASSPAASAKPSPRARTQAQAQLTPATLEDDSQWQEF